MEHLSLLRLAVVLCIGGSLGACAPDIKIAHSTEVMSKTLVWPGEPATPRIAWVKAFSQPQDLGIKKGFFTRLGEFFAGRSAEARLIRPMAVVEAEQGLLYVADPGAKGVHRFDTRKGRHRLIRRAKKKPLPSPVGLAVGALGELYVTDSMLGQVFIIGSDDKIARPMALTGDVVQPTGIAVQPASGRLYIVDTAVHQIKIFSREGVLQSTFGRRGTGPGEFNYPTMIWRGKDDRLYITDSLNFRIQVFDGEGRFLTQFGRHGDGTGDLSRPKGVAIDRQGHIYVVDAMLHAVQLFNLAGEFLLHVGSRGQTPGEFWLPAGIFIGDRDTIYVADSRNQRVQVFQYIGGQP